MHVTDTLLWETWSAWVSVGVQLEGGLVQAQKVQQRLPEWSWTDHSIPATRSSIESPRLYKRDGKTRMM